MGGDTGLHGSAEALPQMEPVSDLHSVGGTAVGALGVGARPVPADDLHTGVTDQPDGQRPGFTVGSTSTTRCPCSARKGRRPGKRRIRTAATSWTSPTGDRAGSPSRGRPGTQA